MAWMLGADFIVENSIVVELKAIVNLEDIHLAQAKNYTVAYNFPIGLLINFGAARMMAATAALCCCGALLTALGTGFTGMAAGRRSAARA